MPGGGANQDPVPHHTGDSHRPKPEAQAVAITAIQDPIAFKIRENAEEHDIPAIEDKVLARSI
jgi:type III secretory pathway component EscU